MATGPLPSNNQNDIRDFVGFLSDEIMIGGDDTLNLISSLYEKVQESNPSYSNSDLEKLLEMHEQKQYNDPEYKDQYRDLREKIYNEAVKVFNA